MTNVGKLLLACTKCSVVLSKIPMGKDYMLCIFRRWAIVDRQSRLMLLIPVTDHLNTEAYIKTFKTLVLPAIGYASSIVFKQDTIFISLYFQSGVVTKGIKLEP